MSGSSESGRLERNYSRTIGEQAWEVETRLVTSRSLPSGRFLRITCKLAPTPWELSSSPSRPGPLRIAGRRGEICPSFHQTRSKTRNLRVANPGFPRDYTPRPTARIPILRWASSEREFLLLGHLLWSCLGSRMTEAGANWKLHNIVAHLPEIPRGTMEQRGPAEFILEAFADPGSVREVVKGKLTLSAPTRAFPPFAPSRSWPSCQPSISSTNTTPGSHVDF